MTLCTWAISAFNAVSFTVARTWPALTVSPVSTATDSITSPDGTWMSCISPPCRLPLPTTEVERVSLPAFTPIASGTAAPFFPFPGWMMQIPPIPAANRMPAPVKIIHFFPLFPALIPITPSLILFCRYFTGKMCPNSDKMLRILCRDFSSSVN